MNTNALYIEHRVQQIITQQQRIGVTFDRTKAAFLIHTIKEKLLELRRTIGPFLHLIYYKYPSVIKVYKADGGYTKRYLNIIARGGLVATGSYCKVAWEYPSLSSRQQLTYHLENVCGWQPKEDEKTATGIPKLVIDNEPVESLHQLEGIGEPLALHFKYSHRLSQIQGFFKHLRLHKYPNGDPWYTIPSEVNTIATNTHRGAHRKVANIPKAKAYVLLGKQMRSLFTVPRGDMYGPIRERRPYRLIGTDAAGLELRVLAHYINDEEYTQEIVHGDAHTRHQEMAGLPNRDAAKTFIYAFLKT